jgi:prepilin-type N-terminal cleavage/methylation domain-containing protein
MNGKGFALTELIVVIAIIATLLTIATLNFSSMSKKAQIERQTRELFAELNQARMDSVFMKKRHKMIMQPNSYTFARFSSADEDRTAGGTTVRTKTVTYQMTKENGSTSIANKIFEFDIRGFTNDLDTIRINPSGTAAQVDCIVVHNGRTNLGKIESNACVLK